MLKKLDYFKEVSIKSSGGVSQRDYSKYMKVGMEAGHISICQGFYCGRSRGWEGECEFLTGFSKWCRRYQEHLKTSSVDSSLLLRCDKCGRRHQYSTTGVVLVRAGD